MFRTLESRPLFALIFWYRAISGFLETAAGLIMLLGLVLFPPEVIQKYATAKASAESIQDPLDAMAYFFASQSSFWLLQIVTISGAVFMLTGVIKLLVANGLARHTNRALRLATLLLFISSLLFFVDVWMFFSWIKFFLFVLEVLFVVFLWVHVQSDEIVEEENSFNPPS
mgnify:CR=1 FL=1